MSQSLLYAIVASPLHGDYSALYQRLNVTVMQFSSIRKAMQALKSHKPDFVVADFVYGYGNNYAGVNISNLDVFLHSLQKECRNAKVIVFADKAERNYVEKLKSLFAIAGVLFYPIDENALANLILEKD